MQTVKRNHAKPPSGGHRYTVGEIVLKGETVDEVLIKMEEHRAENALPLGDPEEDLAKYYSAVAPHLVRDKPGFKRTRSGSYIAAEAIMRFWRAHPPMLAIDNPFIALHEATCDKCPMKRSFPVGDEMKPYIKKARQRAAMVATDREFQKHGQCYWCKLPINLICRVAKPGEWDGLQDPPKPCWVQSS